MNFTFYPELSRTQWSGFEFKLVPQLPIPNAMWAIEGIKTKFDSNYQLLSENERQLIHSFICPVSNILYRKSNKDVPEVPTRLNFESLSWPKLNDIQLISQKACNIGDHQEQTTEIQSPISIDKNFVSNTNDNIKSFSSVEFANKRIGQEKGPSKEDLYNLSVMIQNTNSDFQSILSSDLKSYLDAWMLTKDGLYVSKTICGFSWWFEIYFEKNSKTNRNRRLLKCMHNDCNKIFKKAWNLFDHMRIHTGK